MSQSQFLALQPQGDAQQQLLTLARMQSTLRHRRIEHLEAARRTECEGRKSEKAGNELEFHVNLS